MDFEDGSTSDGGQVEDRRGGRGGRGLAIGGGGLGIVGVILALLFNAVGGGGSSFDITSPTIDPSGTVAPSPVGGISCKGSSGANGKVDVFATCAFNDIQATWKRIFTSGGETYRPATLVLYDGRTPTGCGTGEASTGPFYCPPDQKVYLDLSFFTELRDQLGAKGDTAQAYVIAHEVGHHIQKLLGTSDQVTQLQQRKPKQANALSVRLELQADCYAGVWAKVAQTAGTITFDRGDIDEAIGAAASVGDDRLQKAAGRTPDRETFTHGSSSERTSWFKKGFSNGKPDDCDTFS